MHLIETPRISPIRYTADIRQATIAIPSLSKISNAFIQQANGVIAHVFEINMTLAGSICDRRVQIRGSGSKDDIAAIALKGNSAINNRSARPFFVFYLRNPPL